MAEMNKEYGTALFHLACETGAEEEFSTHLETLSRLFSENPAYVDFLASPAVPLKERLDAIDKAFTPSFPEYIVSFVKLLCKKSRIREFDSCLLQYKQLLNAKKQIAVARVTTSVPLSEAEQKRLTEKLEKQSGHAVYLECSTDPSFIGGIIVEMDGNIIDGSLDRRLREIKEVISR